MARRSSTTSRTLAPDPAERVPPGPDAVVSSVRLIGTDGSTAAILVGRTRVARVDAMEIRRLGIESGTRWTAELAGRVHDAARAHAAYRHALRLIGAGQRSREDLKQRLVRAGHRESDASAAVDRLVEAGLVDDQAMAERLAEHLASGSRLGRRGIEYKLRRKGLSSALSREVSARALEHADTAEMAAELARKRIGRMAGLESHVIQRRLFGFLIRRGFSVDDARRAVESAMDELARDEELH
ncbi:MAG TPA: RecX family transcriptional regulator [Phycisphaerales bacterium]|nr:RecX family transcriptional regulator [Phycisphaerales bacterium]